MSILEFIIFLIIGSIVLPNIYNQINDIINYQPQSEFEPGDLTNDICLGGICLNKCDNLNGQEVKRTGNTALLNQNNTFQAVDCGDDKVLRDLRFGGILCGEEGTDECNSGHCCYPKLCENDLDPLDDDDYNRHYPTPEDKIEKKRRDGNCPYQKTVKKDTPCSGGNPGESGGCTDDGGDCCEDKKCSTHWFSNENPEWGTQTTCPHQPDNVEPGSMMKKTDDTPCDTCDISECCYEQSDFCIVEAHRNGDYNHANTNVQNVAFPSGTSLSSPANDNTSVDLTTNYFLRKTDVSQGSIQNLLSFGSEDGTDDPRYGIKCEEGFKYGMCSARDDSVDEDTCKTHDNNQRECEAAGCSFTLGDRPRVDYSECGISEGETGTEDHNIIKVGSCENTCTADYTLSDNGINYFTQTPISEGANIGSYRVKPDFYSNKLNTNTDFPYSPSSPDGTGGTMMDCYNHTGTGNTLQYNYTCEGGGSYFGVSELSNCNTTCSELHDEGLRCGQGNIYDERKAGDISSYANFRETGDGGCCMPVTCATLSNGGPVSCLPHQTRRTDTQTQDSEVSRDSCCVNKTCTDFKNEYNELSGENVDNTNICLDGRNFNASRELTSAYLYQVSDSNVDKLGRLREYRSGSADYDIGCCSNLTCGEWLNNLNMPDISDDQKLSEASRICGPDKFFVENMFAGDMGETITEDSSCCVGESESTCSPTQELVSTESGNRFTIPGYTIPDGTEFTEKTFNMDTSSGGGEYSINADNISCSAGFTPSDEGIKYKCRINPSTGDGTYYLSGCNSETPDTGSVETSDKLCNLPSQLENSIQLNGFSFDADNNVVNFNHFLGNQDQFSCNESTERPNFDVCPEDFTDMTIKGCHYQDKPRDTGDTFYSDRFFRYNEHIHNEDRTTAHPCENLYNMATDDQYNEDGDVIGSTPDDYRNELSDIETHINEIDPPTGGGDIPSDYAINKMKGNVSNFSCKCQGEGDNECHDHERQVRFKYIFANDEDYYNGDNGFIRNIDAHKRSLMVGPRTETTDCSIYSTENDCTQNKCFWERRAQETCSGAPECSGADMSGGNGEDNCLSISGCIYNTTGECQNPCGEYQNANECPQSCVWDGSVCKNPTQYSLGEILKQGFATVCEPGYYPYRGAKYDYCRPCDDLYKNNHPISAIAESFCDSGHMGDSGNVTNLLDIQSTDNSMNSKYESNSGDIDTLRAVREVGTGTLTNEDYGPYLSDLSGITDANDIDIDFMTADNFTLGARVCDPEPDGDTTCSPRVKIYGDYDQPATEDSQFEKAKKWWRTYFNSVFSNDGGDTDILNILDIISAPSETPIPDESKPTLKSRIDPTYSDLNNKFRENRDEISNTKNQIDNIFRVDTSNRGTDGTPGFITEDTFYTEGNFNNNLLNRWLDSCKSDIDSLEPNAQPSLGVNPNLCSGILGNNDMDGRNLEDLLGDETITQDYITSKSLEIRERFDKYMPFNQSINSIVDLKKENYLYRDALKIEKNDETSDEYISTVCNNNISDVDYIPSFDSVGSNEGSCKECVNKMPESDQRRHGDVPAAPLNAPGDLIVRNINNNDYAPICSYEANMYNESYNEGNIVGFKRKNDNSGEIYQDSERGPCNEGFIYNKNGYDLFEGGGDPDDVPQWKIPQVKCLPENKLITKFCENITEEEVCNKSFSTYLTDNEIVRLSTHLKDNLLEPDESQMINDIHRDGFCGWIINNGEGKCKNIYDTDNGYLSHKSPNRSGEFWDRGEDYTNHNSLYQQQSVLDILSPHITNYTTSDNYDYSNLYNTETRRGSPYQNHGDVFNISNYGVGKDGREGQGDDLTSLSIANTIKEGYDISKISGIRGYYFSNSDNLTYNLNTQPLQPTRINPQNMVLNDDMRNRCHPILWDGPVDFFYENNNPSSDPKTTISSSCYLRKYSDLSDSNSMRNNSERTQVRALVPNNSGDFSIKSTPLYYDKGRKVNGGTITITTTDYDNEDRTHNILNPGSNRDGLMHAYRYKAGESAMSRQLPESIQGDAGECSGPCTHFRNKDSGFADAAVFPLIDRVRGCFNDSLIYPENAPSDSSLGLDADNINNEREQCIFHYTNDMMSPGSDYEINAGGKQKLCINACLNNNDCDLVRMTKNKPQGDNLRCELLKWNKLPDTINTKNTALIDTVDEGQTITDEGPQSLVSDDNTLKAPNLGGHLINANADYDQSTRQGVVNWFERISDPDATEMNHIDTVTGTGSYRTEFYTDSNNEWNNDIREWRLNHLYKRFNEPDGQKVEIKGRPLWVTSEDTEDNEIWVSMNKIRAPIPDGKITDILNNINENELPNNGIRSIDIGGEWRRSYTDPANPSRHGSINEEENYISNDSSTNYPEKYNEKTVIDSSGNHKQCPPGTYVQGTADSYKCSQVINECADCKDIYDYHDKKGDFEGTDDTQKTNLLLSYGCGRTHLIEHSGNIIGGEEFHPYLYPGSRFDDWVPDMNNAGINYETGLNIIDSNSAVYKSDNSNSTFYNQHNLMGKTPDGNIIDVEKCMCPRGKKVVIQRQRNTKRPMGHCE